MLAGSVLGGVIAQLTDLGVPFLIRGRNPRGDVRRRRAADARRRLHSRARREPDPGDAHRVPRVGAIRARQPAGALAHAREPVHRRRRHLRLLRAAAVPARAVGRRRGVHRGRAGGRAALGRIDPGRCARPLGAQALPASHLVDPARRGLERDRAARSRARPQLLGRDRARRGVGHRIRDRRPRAPGLPQRHDPVQAARDRAVVRLADGLRRRSGLPAGPRPRRRRRAATAPR